MKNGNYRIYQIPVAILLFVLILDSKTVISAAAEAIDSTKFPHIVGTVAGDNTFIVIVDAPENAPKLVDLLNETLRFK